MLSTMFQRWRLKLREADEAARQGRLDDARRMLLEHDLCQYLPGQQLAARVAAGLGDRARQLVRDGQLAAGWKQFEDARSLAGSTKEVTDLRDELVQLALQAAEKDVQLDQPAVAIRRLEDLERLKADGAGARELKEAARRFESARHLVQRGKFSEAEAQLDSAATLWPPLASAARERRNALHEKLEQSRDLSEQLHRALAEQRWSDAVGLADRLLEMAPEHRLARDARRRAWENVGARVLESRALAKTQVWSAKPDSDTASIALSDSSHGGTNPAGSRFLLWVDAVGGFLVTPRDEIVLGQAAPGNAVDVPILADLSRRHALIRRDNGGYILEPLQPMLREGRRLAGPVALADGDELQLGSVKLRFRQPHPLSATARLEFVSRHRTQPTCDGILLMAESCVLGPMWQSHVVCRDWARDVVLYRQGEQMFCRALESVEIDGNLCDGRGPITRGSRITGSDFSLSLEALP